MVPPAPDARASGAIAPHSNRVSGDCGLRCRETGFPGQRKKRQYVARATDQRSQRRSGRTKSRQFAAFLNRDRNSPQIRKVRTIRQRFDLILADHQGSSRATLALAPGTGLESPENGRQNRRYRDLDRRQRPHVPHLKPAKMPAKCALFVRDRKTSVRIGLRGGPGRTRNSNQTIMSGRPGPWLLASRS